jgi:hypothetical protein
MSQLNAKRLPRSSPPDSNDPAAQVSGEVDLEPVPRERVMPQHDAAPPPPTPAISEALVTRPSTAPNTVGRS